MGKVQYSLLQDRDWLYSKYINQMLSTVSISREIGCPNPGAVLYALKKHGIPTRKLAFAAKNRKRKGFKALLLRDPIWMRTKYIEEELTIYDIALIAGTSQRSALQSLEFHGIPRRTLSEAAILRKRKPSVFPMLEDKPWLIDQYCIQSKSGATIGRERGASNCTVYKALMRHGIQRRTNSEAHVGLTRPSKYAPLNSPENIIKSYLEKGESTVSLAKKIGALSCNSVRRVLVKGNVSLRNLRDAQINKREDDSFIENRDVLDGGLTGDAYLSVTSHSNICAPSFIRVNKNYSHVLWVAKVLYLHNPEKRIRSLNKGILNGVKYTYPGFISQTKDWLTTYYRRWYPEKNLFGGRDYEKIIPEDVSVSPIALLNCFLDDGSTYQRRKESRVKQVYITLCLEGFYRDNLEMFNEKIKKEYGSQLSITVRRCSFGKGYRIFINQKSYQDFLDIIGKCPLELKGCFGHKWK